MSLRMEIHPGAGGRDAEDFAGDLANAIATGFNGVVRADGKVMVLERL